MEITEKQYDAALRLARKLLVVKGRRSFLNEYDIVHETIVQYDVLSPSHITSVFFFLTSISDTRRGNKYLPTHKVCKKCSPQESLPISMFYMSECKRTGKLIISYQCIKCDNKKTAAYAKANKNNPRFLQCQKKAHSRYYQKIKNNPKFKEELRRRNKRAMDKRNKDPKLKAKYAAYRKAWYAKKVGISRGPGKPKKTQ